MYAKPPVRASGRGDDLLACGRRQYSTHILYASHFACPSYLRKLRMLGASCQPTRSSTRSANGGETPETPQRIAERVGMTRKRPRLRARRNTMTLVVAHLNLSRRPSEVLEHRCFPKQLGRGPTQRGGLQKRQHGRGSPKLAVLHAVSLPRGGQRIQDFENSHLSCSPTNSSSGPQPKVVARSGRSARFNAAATPS